MNAVIRPAAPTDARECIRIRALTRENQIAEGHLCGIGVTEESLARDIGAGRLPGFVCEVGSHIVGYCFGNAATGEVIVLAVLPAHEGQGTGRLLLQAVVAHLRGLGHRRLFLGCSTDHGVRSYGFYRHLGWRSTGTFDWNRDEILELVLP